MVRFLYAPINGSLELNFFLCQLIFQRALMRMLIHPSYLRCREKGSEATFATFTFLTPPSVPVVSVNCLGRCNKGPNARILTDEGAFVEVCDNMSNKNTVLLASYCSSIILLLEIF